MLVIYPYLSHFVHPKKTQDFYQLIPIWSPPKCRQTPMDFPDFDQVWRIFIEYFGEVPGSRFSFGPPWLQVLVPLLSTKGGFKLSQLGVGTWQSLWLQGLSGDQRLECIFFEMIIYIWLRHIYIYIYIYICTVYWYTFFSGIILIHSHFHTSVPMSTWLGSPCWAHDGIQGDGFKVGQQAAVGLWHQAGGIPTWISLWTLPSPKNFFHDLDEMGSN